MAPPGDENEEEQRSQLQVLQDLAAAKDVYTQSTQETTAALNNETDAFKTTSEELRMYSEALQTATADEDQFRNGLLLTGAALGAISLGNILAENNPQGAIAALYGEIGNAATQAESMIKGVFGQVEGLYEIMQSVGGPLRKEYREIQDAFGGTFGAIDDSIGPVNAQAREANRAVTEMYEGFYQTIGDTGVSMYELFDDQQELSGILHDMAEDNRTTFALFAGDADETTRGVALATKGLGVTTAEASIFIQRQIDRTGEANDDMLMEVARTIKATEAASGVSSKLIASNVVDMTRDVSNFGNMTEESMAAASAQMAKMGLDFQSLSSVVGQFQSFEGAASAAADLNALFGINIDVTEAMMAANEGQHHMLDLVRRSMLDAGLTADNLTDNMAAARVAASKYGLEVDDLQRILAAEGVEGIQEILDGQQAALDEGPAELGHEEFVEQFNGDMARMQRSLNATADEFVQMFTDDAVRAGMARTSSEMARMAEGTERAATAGVELGGALAEVPAALAEGSLDGMVNALVEGDDSLFGRMQGEMEQTAAVFQQEMAPIAEDLGRGMGQGMEEYIRGSMEDPESGIGGLLHALETRTGQLREDVANTADEIRSATEGQMVGLGADRRPATSGEVLSAIGEGIVDMAVVGGDTGLQFIEGMRDGMAENADSVIDQAGELFSALTAVAVNEGLIRNSPHMSDQIMEDFAEGIADAENQAAVLGAFGGLFAQVSDLIAEAADDVVGEAMDAISERFTALGQLEIPSPSFDPVNANIEANIDRLNQAAQALVQATTEGSPEINMNITLSLTDEGTGNLIASMERGSVTLGRGVVTQRV